MDARRLIPVVIIVYINMHGDTYPIMSVHIDMPGDKKQDRPNTILHTLKYKSKYGYCNVY